MRTVRWALLLGFFATLVLSAPAVADDVKGGGFLLGATAQHAQDPENPANDVIRINTLADPFYGTVSRGLNVKIHALDNMLEFKAYFLNRSCGGGSPRIQLAVDLDGDGESDGNLHGHWPPPPFVFNCPPGRWDYNDLTDELPRWEVGIGLAAAGFPALTCPSPDPAVNALCPFLTASGYAPWSVVEAVLTTLFPNHSVCRGSLVDDSGWLVGADGVAYYDVISIGRATWVDRSDTSGRGFARGCGKPDHGDHDEDRDGKHDDHD
jgi:hypothetical protein